MVKYQIVAFIDKKQNQFHKTESITKTDVYVYKTRQDKTPGNRRLKIVTTLR